MRFKADLVNILFERHLKQFVPKPGMAELFIEIVCDAYRDGGRRWQKDQTRIMEAIAEQRRRMTKSMELLVSDVINESEYKQIKAECANTVIKCEAELKALNEHAKEEKLDIKGLATLAVENLKKLSDFYANADSDVKREIIGSIYLEKWVFDGEAHRTPEINEVARLIFHINRRLRHKKTGVKTSENFHSGEVPWKGFEPLTHGLENRCSIQLSYQGISLLGAAKIEVKM